ncbi:MAG: glycoside hydrolase family 36 protein [Myxococcota bacterium]
MHSPRTTLQAPAPLLLVALLAACGGDDQPLAGSPDTVQDTAPDAAPAPTGPDGVRIGEAASLRPVVRLDGAWLGGEGCEAEGAVVRCPAGDAGAVVAEVAGAEVIVRFEAARDEAVEALGLVGDADLPNAGAWVSNGFQSWSQSGAVALRERPAAGDLEAALAARGDEEVLRTGEALSWWWTAVGGGDRTLAAAALTADRLRSWAQAWREDDRVHVLLASGGVDAPLEVSAGETLRGERWWVAVSGDQRALIRDLGDALPSRRRDAPVEADAGWNSWYDLWDGVDEEAVRANANLARQAPGDAVPATARPLRVVIDDGWQRGWGDWRPNEKFPAGLDGLAADLHADGFRVGVWLAPLLVEADADLVEAHPEWFVQGATWRHVVHGEMRILDPTHPEAAAHLADTISRVVGWGYDFLKIDFLFAGTFPGGRHEAVTAMEAYGRALETIREAAGPDTVLLAVGAPPTPTLEYVDAWRVGPDIAVESFGPSWVFVPNELRALGARVPYCFATLCDPDPPILRELPREEVETGAWVVALAGGGLFLSDDLRALPEERRTWGLGDGRASLATGGVPAVPEDLLPDDPPELLSSALEDQFAGHSTHVVPRIWRLPDGRRVAFHVGEAPITIEGTEVPARGARILPSR